MEIQKDNIEQSCCNKDNNNNIIKEIDQVILDEFNRYKNRIIDSHCHIQEDEEYIDYVIDNNNNNNKLKFSQCWLMGTTVPDWDRVNRFADVMGNRAVRCFGIHPWFVHKIHPPKALLDTNPEGDSSKVVSAAGDTFPTVIDSQWIVKMRELLLAHPKAIVGEIGVDKVTKCRATGKNEQEPQWIVLSQQIAIAAELDRLVSLHCVQLHGKLLDYFIGLPLSGMPRKVALHTFSGSPSMVKSFTSIKDKGSRFYFGISFINLSSSKVEKLIAAIPDNRLLLESDQNTPTYAEESALDVLIVISKAKGWTIQQSIEKTRENALEFLN